MPKPAKISTEPKCYPDCEVAGVTGRCVFCGERRAQPTQELCTAVRHLSGAGVRAVCVKRAISTHTTHRGPMETYNMQIGEWRKVHPPVVMEWH